MGPIALFFKTQWFETRPSKAIASNHWLVKTKIIPFRLCYDKWKLKEGHFYEKIIKQYKAYSILKVSFTKPFISFTVILTAP